MDRLASLPDNKLFTAISELSREMADFKTAQLISGRSGIVSYNVQSTNTWDYNATVGSDSDGTLTRTSTYTITFTGDGSQAPVLANLSFFVYTNGTQLTPLNNAFFDGSGRSAILSYAPVVESQLSYSQVITLLTQKAITVQIKVYVPASSPGTVSAARTT